jgi:hypothetical protein
MSFKASGQGYILLQPEDRDHTPEDAYQGHTRNFLVDPILGKVMDFTNCLYPVMLGGDSFRNGADPADVQGYRIRISKFVRGNPHNLSEFEYEILD